MAAINGTNLAAPVVPFTTEDSYATHIAQYGKGGWHEVTTVAERNAIIEGRREAGMAVYVTEENKLYILNDDLVTWTLFEAGNNNVNDVKVDGVSVVTNKVANIDLTGKQNVIEDLEEIRENAEAGKSASDTIATYGDVVIHNTDEFATAAQGALADTALQPEDVINDVTHIDTDLPLSANMGKELMIELTLSVQEVDFYRLGILQQV